MRRPAIRRINYVWAATSSLTILAWMVATVRAGHRSGSSTWEAVAVLAIAAIKARLVIQEFMDVRTAPAWLRRTTDAWLTGVWLGILVLYLY